MRFLAVVLRYTCRNMLHSWKSQAMTLLTVSLSVLIFSFFYLIYSNALNIGERLDDDLRLVVYLDAEPAPPLQEEYRHKILKFRKIARKLLWLQGLHINRAETGSIHDEGFRRHKKQL